MIEENIRQKILDLVARSHSLAQSSTGIARDSHHLSQCQAWITEALNVIQLAVSTPDNAYRQNVERIGHGSSQFPQRVASIANIFDALLKDIDAGLVDHTGKKLASVPQTVVKIFISHSSRDVALAAALVKLIRTALNLPSSAIRCTSVPGYKLLGGENGKSATRGIACRSRVYRIGD